MCKKMNWDRLKRDINVKRKSSLPPKPETSLHDIYKWIAKLTPKQRKRLPWPYNSYI